MKKVIDVEIYRIDLIFTSGAKQQIIFGNDLKSRNIALGDLDRMCGFIN